MSNVLKAPDIGGQRHRNSFDMSQRVLFTSSVGQLLPVYYDLLNPGDKVMLSSSILTRTQELASSAMTRIVEHVDFFFVPYRRIWSNFEPWFTSVNDIQSTKLAVTSGTALVHPSVELFKNYDLDTNSDDVDEFGIRKVSNNYRIFDLLNFGYSFFSSFSQKQMLAPVRINPAVINCYHAIYQDFYRLDSREYCENNLSNMDSYTDIGNSVPLMSEFFKVYYRPWKHDFYTNVYPSQLYSPTSSSNGSGSSMVSAIPTPPVGSNVQDFYGSNMIFGNDFGSYSTRPSSNNNNLSSLSLDSIRRAGALERLALIQNFTRKFWSAQLAQRFGISIPRDTNHVIYIGSNHSNIQISDVVATATTETSQLGEIAGKGIGLPQQQKPFEFTSPCHGFVMAIYSAEPVSDYRSYGLDRLHTYLDRNDFYQPEFDGLGMQPIYAYQSNMTPDLARNNTPLGWQFRYSELKNKPDIIHGAFMSSLSFWTTSRSNQTQNIGVDNFKISPNYLNSIMLTYFDVKPDDETSGEPVSDFVFNMDAFGRDPLLHNLYIQSYKTSIMSTYSLPNHNAVLL